MVVVMAPDATDADIARVVERVEGEGGEAFVSRGLVRTIIGLVGDVDSFHHLNLRTLPGVADVHRISDPFKLVSRQHHPHRSTVHLGSEATRVAVGPDGLLLGGGLGSTGQHAQVLDAARMAASAGARLLVGGIVRPRGTTRVLPAGRTLEALAEARSVTGLPLVVGVAHADDVEEAAAVADGLRVAGRHASDEELLAAVGEQDVPVLLERPVGATVEEWLMAAEHIAQHGNLEIVLCERGVPSAEPAARTTFDIAAVPLLQAASHLPVVVDVSRAAGRPDLVVALARAAIAVGADGVLVEVHPAPETVPDGGVWALADTGLRDLAQVVRRLPSAVGRAESPS